MNHFKPIIFSLAVGVALLTGVTSLMPESVYSSAWWSCVWIIVLGVLFYSLFRSRLVRNIPVFLLHLSFALMIAGGFLTAYTSHRGTLHLTPGILTSGYVDDAGKSHDFPASVSLISFSPEYYQGMSVPKDFRSEVAVESGDTMHISMNHIGRLGNYRFYQTSFDNVGGTILTVSHDPYGIATVYSGFVLFAVAGAWMLCRRFGRKGNHAAFAMAVMLTCATAEAGAVPAISASMADSLSLRQVMYNGRAVPFNTVATRLTFKLTGRGEVAGLSPEAFTASLMMYRDEWCAVPFIKIKSDALRSALGISGKYASVNSLYRDGVYLPGEIYQGGNGRLDRDIVSLDEKMALLIDLWKGELFTPLPDDSPEVRSDMAVRLEVSYNRLMPPRVLFICSIILAISAIIAAVSRRRIILWPLILTAAFVGGIFFVWHWYVAGSFPLASTGDMMEFLGLCTLVIASYAGYRKYPELLIALVLLCASFLLLVAWISAKDPVMSPVMPVLASPWLSIHVSLVMVAYAILGFTLPCSILALTLSKYRRQLTALSLSLLGPGTWLLGMGIITGAMWANVSWGRYWAWDPKETWALVTLMLYAIPLHRSTGLRYHPKAVCIYLILIFSSIIMTYYGVNYLPSIHAYK